MSPTLNCSKVVGIAVRPKIALITRGDAKNPRRRAVTMSELISHLSASERREFIADTYSAR